MRVWSSILTILLFVALAGCGGDGSAAAEPPCVVPTDEMGSILDRSGVIAAPQGDGVTCIYATEGQPLIALSVRTPAEFQAERAKFEDQGILLPELVPVQGFDGEANVDPRYNSLNVTAGNTIVSVEVVGVEPSEPADKVALEKEIARAAVERV